MLFPNWKFAFRIAAAGAALTAAAITAGQPAAGADNHCPTGCTDTTGSTVISPDLITQATRKPWVVGKPHPKPSDTSSLNRRPPARGTK